MRRWRQENKEHVIEELSENADGMYKYFMMLVTLTHGIEQVPMGLLSA